MMLLNNTIPSRFGPALKKRLARTDSGIAIGPILFIIAVLGILAAAIAAGSTSFTSGTASTGNRAKASALVDIGQNLKIGFDRIIGNGIDFDAVVINPSNTSATVDLFSPSGGGIVAPPISMGISSTISWQYPTASIGGVGTARLAVLQVAKGVCDEINTNVNTMDADAALTNIAAIGDLTTASSSSSSPLTWPAAFDGKLLGCVDNSSSATGVPAGYYFYQVLGVR